MKHLFSFLAAALMASAAWTQTTVTLTVDMTNEMVSTDGIHVAGNFQGWEPGDTPMMDNGDGTWSYTFTSDTAATYQYKFVNGNMWGSDESVPAACAFDNNRQITVDGMMGDVSAEACFGNCAACGITTVKFRVDMANEEVSTFGVHVAGDFQSWDASSTPLTDEDGDMIYEAIYSFDASGIDEINFKFINGNDWTDTSEQIGEECGDGGGNRTLAIDETDIVLSANESGAAYCFNSCSSCVLPLIVNLEVDATQLAEVSLDGIFVAGTFTGWNQTAMDDSDGDGIYTLEMPVTPGDNQFKFLNGNDGWENVPGECGDDDGFGGFNRIATFDEENTGYACCFAACPGDACVPEPDVAPITFRINLNTDEVPEGSVPWIWGSFTGWQGGALEMTDADADGIWEVTQEVSGDATVKYKYSLGAPVGESGTDYIEDPGLWVVGMDSTMMDTLTLETEMCGIPNGFGGYDRIHVRSGEPEILDVVCWNRCSDCEGSDVGVEDFALTFGLFPNPATDRVVLLGAHGNAEVVVLDAQGRAAMTLNNVPMNGRYELDVTSLDAGVYVVVMRQGLKQGAQRVLIH